MVCLGNICRSPLAEGLMRHKALENNLHWHIDSAGTGAYHTGQPPHPSSIAMAGKYGIDISTQRARQIAPADLAHFDILFVMDADNERDVRRLCTAENEHKIKLLLNEAFPGENRAVPDPYGQGEEAYRQVFELIDKACTAFIDRHKNGPNSR